MKQHQTISLHVKQHVLGKFLGSYRSLFRGKGIDYDEIRKFVPGDDIKAIVWAKLAQMGEVYVKTFLEERDLTVLICLDTSSSIFWSRIAKSQLALETAATLIFSSAISRDRTGLALFNNGLTRFLPPRKGLQHAGQLIEELQAISSEHKDTSLKKSFFDIKARRGPKRAVIFVISDFISEEEWHPSLLSLSKHNDLILLSIQDDWEASPPDVGRVYAADAEKGSLYLLNCNHQFSLEIQRTLQMKQRALQQFTTAHNIGYLPLQEGSDPIQKMRIFFRERQQRLQRR